MVVTKTTKQLANNRHIPTSMKSWADTSLLLHILTMMKREHGVWGISTSYFVVVLVTNNNNATRKDSWGK